MKLDRILVGVDFSPQSEVAVARALDLAALVSAEVVLLHVIDRLHLVKSFDATLGEGPRWPEHVESIVEDDKARLTALGERYARHPVEVRVETLEDHADTGMCKAAIDFDADLVVVGSHGRTGLTRYVLGSIAERVVRLCERSVLVARPKGDTETGFGRILVASDFSESSEKALRMALVLAAPGAAIDVLHCWSIPPMTESYYATYSPPGQVSVRQEVREAVEARGEALVSEHARGGVSLAFRSIEAPPAMGIEEEADRGDYDLVITGSHGRRGVRRFLIGSVAELIVRHVDQSVLVVHGDAAFREDATIRANIAPGEH